MNDQDNAKDQPVEQEEDRRCWECDGEALEGGIGYDHRSYCVKVQ